MDFRPSSMSSSGKSLNSVPVMNPHTSLVRPSPRREFMSGVKCSIFDDITTSSRMLSATEH